MSNFFGRNKRVTIAIKRKILWCRSHYQTNAYQSENWKYQRLGLIREQAMRIDEDDQVLYTICLKNEEAERLNSWVARGVDLPVKDVSHHRGRCFRAPMWALRFVENEWVGVDMPLDAVLDFVQWVGELLRSQRLEDIPMVEFLPQYPNIRITLQKAQNDSLRRAKARDPDEPNDVEIPEPGPVVRNNVATTAAAGDVDMTDADSDATVSEAGTTVTVQGLNGLFAHINSRQQTPLQQTPRVDSTSLARQAYARRATRRARTAIPAAMQQRSVANDAAPARIRLSFRDALGRNRGVGAVGGNHNAGTAGRNHGVASAGGTRSVALQASHHGQDRATVGANHNIGIANGSRSVGTQAGHGYEQLPGGARRYALPLGQPGLPALAPSGDEVLDRLMAGAFMVRHVHANLIWLRGAVVPESPGVVDAVCDGLLAIGPALSAAVDRRRVVTGPMAERDDVLRRA